MKIPRPSGGSRQSNGVGKIFIKYEDSNGARKALQALAGRKFQDRTVVTTYFSEVSFFLDLPPPPQSALSLLSLLLVWGGRGDRKGGRRRQ